MARIFLQVDPRTLRLPPSRLDGADPIKLTRQISRFGIATEGMPAIIVFRDQAGEMMVWEGVTRATRVARLLPGSKVWVEVIREVRQDLGRFPTVEERLP